MSQQVEDIGFDGMICGNGAYIEAKDNILRSRTISRDEVKRIVDYLDLHQLEYYIEANDGLYGSRGFEEECKRIPGVCALSGIDKAEAIEELLNYLQMNKADTVAFGDAEVDIPMFQIAATFVTDNVECDGVWKALKQLEFI